METQMKNSLQLTLALACALALFTGCKTTPPRVTKFGETTGAGSGMPSGSRPPVDLSTPPLAAGEGAQSTGVTGTTLPSDSTLPDESKLDGRDLDRGAFAAQTVYFGFDEASVPRAEAAKIQQVVDALKAKGPGHDLLVEGHCDERGTEEYNRSLGERRALAVRELLVQSGVSGGQVFTRTFGKDKPVDPGHTEAAWSKNRRAEFILVLPRKITTTQNAQ
jgi:peptidoglycan-associated lipoprotein